MRQRGSLPIVDDEGGNFFYDSNSVSKRPVMHVAGPAMAPKRCIADCGGDATYPPWRITVGSWLRDKEFSGRRRKSTVAMGGSERLTLRRGCRRERGCVVEQESRRGWMQKILGGWRRGEGEVEEKRSSGVEGGKEKSMGEVPGSMYCTPLVSATAWIN